MRLEGVQQTAVTLQDALIIVLDSMMASPKTATTGPEQLLSDIPQRIFSLLPAKSGQSTTDQWIFATPQGPTRPGRIRAIGPSRALAPFSHPRQLPVSRPLIASHKTNNPTEKSVLIAINVEFASSYVNTATILWDNWRKMRKIVYNSHQELEEGITGCQVVRGTYFWLWAFSC